MKFNIISIFIACFMFVSCKNSLTKEYAISKTTIYRKEVGLKDINSKLQADSTFKIKHILKSTLTVYDKVDYDKKENNHYEVVFFSDQEKTFIKSVFFKVTNDQILVVEEQDKYYKEINDLKSCWIILTHDYLKNVSEYRVDTIPSKQLIDRNNVKLKETLIDAKKSNQEICGTVRFKIKHENYPLSSQSMTIIDAKQFNALIQNYK